MIRTLLIFFSLVLCAQEEVFLHVPDLSRENVIGVNVGIRPYRKTGVRIEEEWLGDKLVIHNYGYGGSGLTLSLGGSQEVVRMLQDRSGPVAVLGAGVIGLATAYDLSRAGVEVHLYADAWEDLTSDVAAGIWSPMKTFSAEKGALMERVHEVAHERFAASEFAGARWIDCYSFRNGDFEKAIQGGKGDPVIVHFDNGLTKMGKRVREIGVDGKLFLEDLRERVAASGVVSIQRHFSAKEELLQLEESVIVNCTSMGSIELFGDEEFLPCRGQIVYFKPQENFDYLFYDEVPGTRYVWVSIYPWSDRIVLGGIYEHGVGDCVIEPATIDQIIENAQKSLD